jgi:chemotaxis-related protein WspD
MSNGMETANTVESCWNSIGVWSSHSARCPKLAEMTHCRNCPVFIAAGSNLLNRKFPPGYMDEWAEFLAQKKESQNANNISIIIFRIGREFLALRSAIFREIISPRPVRQIPHRSNDVLLGLTNVHGELQLCFSLKALIGYNDVEKTEDSAAKMLVIQNSGECWVFPVDQTLGVFRCNDGDARNVPVTVSKAAGTFTKKVMLCDQREVGLLDDELLIYTLQRRIS